MVSKENAAYISFVVVAAAAIVLGMWYRRRRQLRIEEEIQRQEQEEYLQIGPLRAYPINRNDYSRNSMTLRPEAAHLGSHYRRQAVVAKSEYLPPYRPPASSEPPSYWASRSTDATPPHQP